MHSKNSYTPYITENESNSWKQGGHVLNKCVFLAFCLFLGFFQVTTCFGIAVTTQVYIGYAIVALIIELNSIFLHLRQLFQVLKVPKDSNIYRTNSLICLGKCSLYFWSWYCARDKKNILTNWKLVGHNGLTIKKKQKKQRIPLKAYLHLGKRHRFQMGSKKIHHAIHSK